MIYILLCLSLSLAGITGLLFFYLAYLDRMDKDQKNRIRELERQCQYLTSRLDISEAAVEELSKPEARAKVSFLDEDDSEMWADVLEET